MVCVRALPDRARHHHRVDGLSGFGAPVTVILYDKRLDVWTPGAHTGTFRGNQLAFAAGAQAIRIIRRAGVLHNVRSRGEQIVDRLAAVRSNPWVRDVRGIGLMWGIELADPRGGRPSDSLARRVQALALGRGLILEVGGRDDCVVGMLPPLNVTAEVVNTACSILIDTINDCCPRTSRSGPAE
jgi:diaminobutyrate-2-oxoglutarate transaminase